MKINSLNAINFKRAIKVKIDSHSYYFDYGHNTKNGRKNLNSPADDVVDMMKNRPNQNYDEQTSRKIANFVRRCIGDTGYKEGGFFSRIVDGDFYIFSGEEAKKAREIIDIAKKQKQELDQRYLEGPTPDMSQSEQVVFSSEKLHKIESKNITIRRDKKLLELAENGEYRNPDTYINIETVDKKIKKIEYYNSTQEKVGPEPFDYKYNKITKALRV